MPGKTGFELALDYLDENHKRLVASGVLDPRNNKHLYEHLRGNPNYAGFCQYIFGDKLNART